MKKNKRVYLRKLICYIEVKCKNNVLLLSLHIGYSNEYLHLENYYRTNRYTDIRPICRRMNIDMYCTSTGVPITTVDYMCWYKQENIGKCYSAASIANITLQLNCKLDFNSWLHLDVVASTSTHRLQFTEGESKSIDTQALLCITCSILIYR